MCKRSTPAQDQISLLLGDPDPGVRVAGMFAIQEHDVEDGRWIPEAARRSLEADDQGTSAALANIPGGRWQVPFNQALTEVVADLLAQGVRNDGLLDLAYRQALFTDVDSVFHRGPE